MAEQRTARRGGGPGGMPMGVGRPKNLRLTAKRLFGYLGRNWLLIFAVVGLLFISTISMLAGSYFLKPLINNYILPGDFQGFALALTGLGAIYLVGVLASYIQTRLTITVAQNTTNTLRRELFDRLQGLPLKYFDTHTHGELMSRFTNDIDNVQMMLEQSLTQLLSSVITFIGAVTLMVVLSPVLFLITAAVLAFMVFLSVKIGGKSRQYFKRQQKILGDLNGYIEEMISGLKEVKVFSYEEKAAESFNRLNEDYRKTASEANFLAGIIMPIMMNLNNVCYAATAVFGGILTISGSFDIGSLAAFLQYSRQFGQPITQITSQLNNVLAAMAGAERVFEVMDEKPETDEGAVSLVNVQTRHDGTLIEAGEDRKTGLWAWKIPKNEGTELMPLKGDVRLHNVTFSYDGKKTVLFDISLYAKPGQTIALVGSTGAGKTTVTSLINRFYDVENGSITYDGIDVREIKKGSLRRSLGMVLQDTHLFTGTVMDNIRYGRLDATDEDCVRAAKTASAHSFISRLPDGYHTAISGDGANLSQGQRQLIAISRVCAADPPVMILDEATSSIDTRTERLIEKGMLALMRGRTVFVIAHRLSTVRNASAIIVVEDGQIIERGDHEDLLSQKGRYYQLYTGAYVLD